MKAYFPYVLLVLVKVHLCMCEYGTLMQVYNSITWMKQLAIVPG